MLLVANEPSRFAPSILLVKLQQNAAVCASLQLSPHVRRLLRQQSIAMLEMRYDYYNHVFAVLRVPNPARAPNLT